eukprot:TRINITY_DN866_c0_g1_i9.p1 TRINITY_DN866_c0_g1~~TRINITY_DN866_c0_g1_i9.p1  ORF type:complete len:789 (-),score=85.44 TRINITY_DN866_c0_g1_i9:63-2429(-)
MLAKIKGTPSSLLAEEIRQTISKVGLEQERGKKAELLSGGNKRKLSLGMAIIGGSQIIFMDEPTSGMDPASRRRIWNLIKTLKNEGRTVILTTHFLDEADYLADRIGIMNKGKLFILGDSDYIKKKFGEGYTVSLTAQQPISPELRREIKDKVHQLLPKVAYDEKTSQETIKFVFPFDEQERFVKVFQTLEEYGEFIINLEMNSLEDAFLNILKEDHDSHEKDDREVDTSPEQNQVSLSLNEFPCEVDDNCIQKDLPLSLSQSPSYSFVGQLLALFRRKLYLILRSKGTLFLYVQPLIPIVIFMITQLIKQQNQDKEEIQNRTQSLMLFIFSFLISVHCGSVVKEREQKIVYALKAMGMRSTTYWLSNFTFDYLFFLLISVALSLYIYFNDLSAFQGDNMLYFVILILVYGVSQILHAYFWSFIFSSSGMAYLVYSILIQFLIGFQIPQQIKLNNSQQMLKMQTLLYVSPLCAFQEGIEFITKNGSIYQDQMTQQSFIGRLLVQIIWEVAFITLFEYLQRKVKGSQQLQVDATQQPYLDESVRDEAQKVKEIFQNGPSQQEVGEQSAVLVKDLTKKYSNQFVALNGISFAVEQSSIFGLLGPNGAGKSTSFNILTAALKKSGGQIKLNSNEFDYLQPSIFQEVGICPQYDCIWEDLTVYDHLDIFGRVKGLSGESLEETIRYYIKTLDLTQNTHKAAGKLSGGSKRKLSVAIALIAAPSIQYFDEPSTGLDPYARRCLWDTITNSMRMKKATVILTTHSMSEAESLCNKIGMLVNGKFVSIGLSLIHI